MDFTVNLNCVNEALCLCVFEVEEKEAESRQTHLQCQTPFNEGSTEVV